MYLQSLQELQRPSAIDHHITTAHKILCISSHIESIANLSHLKNLQILSIRANRIAECVNWHIQLGNLVSLNLSQKRIRRLKGFSKLFDDVNEIDHIGNLPLLENLRLMWNPKAGSVGMK
ncbi:dynein axonemal light chain 1-like [Uranotaenia lowii]|uniref:dynein axonemal light chain 1-like n=1 Tax=Uranotaenia lowii TaxID=190385 RepID=UPI002478E2BE|nr:dynein axonemal light chain 1-like [Uranotaenia lowii]